MDVTITGFVRFKGIQDPFTSLGQGSSMIIVMRALRMARVMRLVKLLHSPLLKDLANMLVGLAIGMPSLLWVLVLFVVVLYSFGLLLRFMLGPQAEQDLISTCGFGDDVVVGEDPDCPIHSVYGEEFFGSLSLSMFTTFRFMLGDSSTAGGKSLAVMFSQGYGSSFMILYSCFMVAVMFGLFNIITAIFVDSTIAGLKHNDVRRKYARQYEKNYVQGKLRNFLQRVSEIVAARRDGNAEDIVAPASIRKSVAMNSVQPMLEEMQLLTLDEDDFREVMEDMVIKMVLQDLDVEMYNPSGMFDTFDPDGNKSITTSEMIQAIMKLRGGPQKNDLIASWVAIKALHEKVDDLALALTDLPKEQPPEFRSERQA